MTLISVIAITILSAAAAAAAADGYGFQVLALALITAGSWLLASRSLGACIDESRMSVGLDDSAYIHETQGLINSSGGQRSDRLLLKTQNPKRIYICVRQPGRN